jgi:hypothetical protein
MVIDVVRLQDGARELGEEIVFLVGRPVGTYDADLCAAVLVAHFGETTSNEFEGFFPG